MSDRVICFTPGSVVYSLEATEKYAAIHELIEKAPVFRNLGDPESFERSVIQRERLQSTGFGKGVAFAHGRTADVDSFFIALGISRRGIPFDAVDGCPVHLLFIIANNPRKNFEYLRALSTLAELIRDEVFRSRLLKDDCTQRLEQMLCGAFASGWIKKTA